MKRMMIFSFSSIAFSFLFGIQSSLAAMWYDITGPYGTTGETISVGTLHIDESTCSGETCGMIGTAFSSPPFSQYSFNFSIPSSGPTYTSADLVAASYVINEEGELDAFDGFLSDNKEIFSDGLGVFTIADFDVQYSAISAPAAVPLPATLPLYGIALMISAIFAWRKRRYQFVLSQR